MFKTYNVAETFWQMNLFFTMQMHRGLSDLSYMQAARATDSEAEDEIAEAVDDRPARHRSAAQ